MIPAVRRVQPFAGGGAAVAITEREVLVTIEKATETQGVGEPILTWTEHAKWWAEKIPLGGNEGPAGGQDQYGSARHEWKGLFMAGVLSKMRLNQGGILFDIDFVDDTLRAQNRLRVVTTQPGA